MNLKICFIDDDRTQLRLYELLLERSPLAAQIEWKLFDQPAKARAALLQDKFSLVFLDLGFWNDTEKGFELLKYIQKLDHKPEVIIASAQANFNMAKRAMQLGASDFIHKATAALEIPLQIERIMRQKQILLESQAWRDMHTKQLEQYKIWGESQAVKRLRQQIEKLAPTELSVLIEGETGVGKELVARNLHLLSQRSAGAFVAMDCGTIPLDLAESIFFGHEKGAFTSADNATDGLFRQADGGTLFLDEITSLPLRLQAKLLRALEEKEIRPVGSKKSMKVDVRLITAGNEDLIAKTKSGDFRADLYYRIAAVRLGIEPLRSRPGDIAILAKKFAYPKTISSGVIRDLQERNWPGNIRELKNCIQVAVALSGDSTNIEPEHMQFPLSSFSQVEITRNELNWHQYMKNAEFRFLKSAYAIAGGNVSECARMVGLDRVNLFHKLKRAGVHKTR